MKSRKHRSQHHDQNIGAALRHHRIARGPSQPKLGDMIGVCHQQIQKYENGTDRLAASTAVDLAEQFGVTVDELLGLNGLDNVLAKPVCKTGSLETARARHSADLEAGPTVVPNGTR